MMVVILQSFKYNLAIFQNMHRKSTNHSLQSRILQSISSLRITSHNWQPKELEILLYTAQQRPPLSVIVPRACKMKMLKRILYQNLKQELAAAEFSKIIGFQAVPPCHLVDYQLHQGVGELHQQINLICLYQTLKYQPDSLLNYKICKLISVGGFSKVYLLRNLRTGDFQAGKFMLKQNANVSLIENEFVIASQLNHPFIVKTRYFVQTQHFYVIIMEFLPGGELFDLLKTHRHMPEHKARFYLVETLLALKCLHQQNIIYRDVKPENIIIDHAGHIKLTDFGLAKKGREKSYSFCGSLDYMAPEILENRSYSQQIDYYSIGNLLFQILMGSPPFYHPKYTQQQTKYHIMYSQLKFTESMKLSPEVMDLLAKLLEKKPENRLGHSGGIDEILEHQWFEGVNLQDYLQKLVDPPVRAAIKFQPINDQPVQEKIQWEKLFEADLRNLKRKAEFNFQKSVHARFKNRKSCDEIKRSPSTPHKRSLGKLKSNISLLQVMNQRRSSSVAPLKKYLKSPLTKSQPRINRMFKSLDLSRKSSFAGLAEGKERRRPRIVQRQSSPGELPSNFVLVFKKKSKQNVNAIRKKCKQGKPDLKFTK